MVFLFESTENERKKIAVILDEKEKKLIARLP